MPRPRHCRYVKQKPQVTFFKPQGIPMKDLTWSTLKVEGLEALRLADMEGLTAKEASERMRISRHTFGRILSEARRIVAEALVQAQALCIEGGTHSFLPPQQIVLNKEYSMKRIAVSSEGTSLDAMVDSRFGRAHGFIIIDPTTMETTYLDNSEARAMSHGAGIETAQRIANAGVGVVLSGFVGPKALDALTAAGIKVYQDMDGITVQEAIDRVQQTNE